MSYWLVAAAVTLGLVAIAHSWLGERHIIRRILRRDDLPRLFGSDWFTRRTLRFAWHLTSIAWVGMAAILVALAAHFGDARSPAQAYLTSGRDHLETVGVITAGVLLLSAAVTAAASRGRHLAWIAFAAAGAFTFIGVG